MNTANKLTLCRVVMIPIFIVLLYLEFAGHLWVALAVFILASITDFVDGYVARHYNQVTDFGKFMDPLADKLLVMSAMVWFVEVGWMPAWACFVVIARELAVTGLRLVAVEQGLVIAAGKSGKVKTASTMVCICLLLAIPNETLRLVCVAVILVTTVYSGVEYFVKNRQVILSRPETGWKRSRLPLSCPGADTRGRGGWRFERGAGRALFFYVLISISSCNL